MSNEADAKRIAKELADEMAFAGSRPCRSLDQVDVHLDKLMEKTQRLALIVARIAAGSD